MVISSPSQQSRTAAHLTVEQLRQGHSSENRLWQIFPSTRRRMRSMSCGFAVLLYAAFFLGYGSAQTTAPNATQPQTFAPTGPPTDEPSSKTTSSPTLLPTGSASEVPTLRPTQRPTRGSTGGPTPVPTYISTSLPSSLRTTQTPTISQTQTPTTSPTNVPTQSPIIGTRSPVKQLPTASPIGELPDYPSSPIQSYKITGVMQLRTMPERMTASQRIDWEITTASHILEVLRSREDFPVTELDVDTEVMFQNEIREASNNVGQLVVEVEFFVEVAFRSTKTTYDVSWMVEQAFDSVEDVTRYIQRLRSANEEIFRGVDSIVVKLEGRTVTPDTSRIPEIEEPGEGSDVILYVIAGAGGGCGLVVLGLCVLYLTRKSRSSSSPQTPNSKPSKGDHGTHTSDQSPLGLAADIVVDRRQDDISTLGDPVPISMQPSPDDQTASIGTFDYDYSQEYRRAHGMPDHGSLERNESVGSRTANSASFLSSDHSLDMMLEGDPQLVCRFEVTVPPGKLGIVMDNSPSGTPMVFAVKPESVLVREVQVGDRLLSVDQEDVTFMTATQVSKLISLKNDQERTLVFCRIRSTDKAQAL